MSATARNTGSGAEAEVEVSLRDAANRPVPADRDLTARIEARQFSGSQSNFVIIKAGSTSARCSFRLHEGGLIELRVSHPEMRPDTTFVRLKSFAPAPAEAIPGFTPNPAGGAPDTHLGREVAKVGNTADDLTRTGKSIQDTFKMFGSWLGTVKASQRSAILVGSQDRRYLADGQDAAIAQIFLPVAASKKIQFRLSASGGKLDPDVLTIEADHDTTQTRLTSDRPGTIEVKCETMMPKGKLVLTNTLKFSFGPPIVRLAVRTSPPKITLLDTAELQIQLQNSRGEYEKTDEPRLISLDITHGRGEIASQTSVIAAGNYQTSIAFRPTGLGAVAIQASTDSLPAEAGQVHVTLPTMLLSVSAFGGCIGGLFAAFHTGLPASVRSGSIRRRLKYVPWWRMVVGSITGFVLYWSFIFLSFSVLPRGTILNPFSTFVFSLLGGWMGLNVFSLVLKRLHLQDADSPLRAPKSATIVKA